MRSRPALRAELCAPRDGHARHVQAQTQLRNRAVRTKDARRVTKSPVTFPAVSHSQIGFRENTST